MKSISIILAEKIKKCSINELEKVLGILFPNAQITRAMEVLRLKLKEKDNFHFNLNINPFIEKDPKLVIRTWNENPFQNTDISVDELIEKANPTEKQLEMIILLIS